MAITLTWTRVLSLVQRFFQSGSAGARVITTGEVIAALCDTNPTPEQQVFYASQDQGLTWTARSSLPVSSSNKSTRWIHWPGNIQCYCSTDEDQEDLFVWRSTDGCATWTKVYTLSGPTGASSNPYAAGAVTWNRSAGAFVGDLEQTITQQTLSEMIYTTDKGLNWTNFGMISPGASNDQIWCISARPGANFLVGASPNTAYKGTGITSWSSVGTLPNPGGIYLSDCFDAAWVTDADAVLAGYEQNFGPPYVPAVWYSSDAAASWTAVPAADIIDWPNTGFFRPQTRTVQRLTSHAVAMGLAQINGRITPPVVISLDRGHTYTLKGTGWTYGVDTGIISHGSMATTTDGHLIAVVDVGQSGQQRTEIWRGEFTC